MFVLFSKAFPPSRPSVGSLSIQSLNLKEEIEMIHAHPQKMCFLHRVARHYFCDKMYMARKMKRKKNNCYKNIGIFIFEPLFC